MGGRHTTTKSEENTAATATHQQSGEREEEQPSAPAPEDLQVSWNNIEKEIMGCPHYMCNNKIQAECCKKWYVCRFCHDEKEGHPINRFATKYMVCLRCKTTQTAAKRCQKCGLDASSYYCDVCKLWSSDPKKPIYHCNKCGVCRVGKGLNVDYFHCDKCNACLQIGSKDNHKCIENLLHSNCPICIENLFQSVTSVYVMKCGHAMHFECYNRMVSEGNDYKCPTCNKTVVDNVEPLWDFIDAQLEREILPEPHNRYLSLVFCNDCEQRSNAKFHFLHHKCAHCKGYNTKVLRTIKPPHDHGREHETEEEESSQR